MLAALLLCAAGFAAEISAPGAPKAPSLIILPESAAPQQAPALILPPGLIAPSVSPILAPAASPILGPDGAPAAPQPDIQLATPEDLARLAARGPAFAPTPAQADPGQAAGSLFDGSRAPSAQDWDEVRRPNLYFAGGPRGPELSVLDAAARALFQRLLPRFYRPIPVKTIPSQEKFTGAYHSWSEKEGHVIEFKPAEPDERGQVESKMGQPGNIVQQKIEYLMEYLHEFSHAIFDEAVRKREDHEVHTAHVAMTEGFAVTLERLLIEGLLNNAPALGLTPRDADDLRRIHASRQRWLQEEDNAYSEGEPVWRRAYQAAGEEGVLSLLSSLSVQRLVRTARADPIYQLSLGNNELLSAYLGHDAQNRWCPGLEALSKALAGAALLPDEARDASAVIEAAGKEGRRRLFKRVLSRQANFETTAGDFWNVPAWLRKSASLAPAFALAAINPTASRELAQFLAQAARTPHGLDRVFEKQTPSALSPFPQADRSPRVVEIVSRAEKLSWTPEDRAAWDAAIIAWLAKGARP